jgi:GNAT superfamily N-acetyltransferase
MTSSLPACGGDSTVQLQIRRFHQRDAADIIDLSLRAWEPVFESLEATLGRTILLRLHPDWRCDQRRAVEDVLATEAIEVWVASSADGIAGFAAIKLSEEKRMGEVYMIAVDPRYQRNGVGAQLMSFALDRMRDGGMTVAMVDTGGDPGHAPARHVYEKAGFTLLPIARYFKAL